MIYLEAEGLTKSFGERTLFENLNLTIPQGQKIALVARNGAGKTTLLNILANKEECDEGEVRISNKINYSYLPQNPDFDHNSNVINEVLKSENPIMKAIKKYEEALNEQAQNATAEAGEKLQEAMDDMEARQAWDYESQVKETLSKLNIHDHQQSISELSGGQKKRVALAKVLIENPEFLIMDEPTNHLDLDMVEWIEETLTARKMTLLLVTHDRYFLNRVTNEIIELEYGNLYRYRGNFEYYLEKKAEWEANQQSQIEEAQKQYQKELAWIKTQPKARGTKSKSRVQRAEDLKKQASQKTETQQVQLEASMSRMGKKIIELQNVSKSFDDTVILDHFNYSFNKGDRIGIVGPNGTGKTTFLNILTQEIKADNGSIDTGETIVFGYYKQEFPPIPEDKKVIDVVREIAEYMDMGDGRKLTAFQLLQKFLFSKKMQHSFVRKLSGGEKRRLHLLTILMKSPNFLILDEPTNDLDILTLSVLEDFLKSFQGCLITVTHDRYFLDKLVNHLFVFEGEGKVVDFNGTYSEYRQQKKNVVSEMQKPKSNEEPKAKDKAKQPPKQEKHQKKLSYKEQLRLEEIEKNLETLEQKKEALESQLNQGNADGEQLNEWSKELQDVLKQIEEQEHEWFELSEMAE